MSYQKEMSILYNELCQKYDMDQSDWFGGIFFDQCGKLNLQVTECFQGCREQILAVKAFGGAGNVRTSAVKYSFKSLKKLCGEIVEDMDAEKGSEIVGAGIHMETNRITLLAKAGGPAFEGESYGDRVEQKSAGGYELHTDVSPADRLSNGACYFSAGYPAKKAGEEITGIVTAGHLSNIVQAQSILFGEEKIGTVYEYEYSSKMDAAFVKLEPVIGWTARIAIDPGPRISGISPELIAGASVAAYGGESGKRYLGRVVYPMFDYKNSRNIMVFSYLSSCGDSGAPIVLLEEGETCLLVGIHLGSLFIDGTYYSFGKSAQAVNERFSLSLQM